jgi:hypothetical protein
LGSALILASGCGTIALKHSFDNYSDTYAETQNRQMLENLARLSNREPIYFFQLAQISAGYTFTETGGIGDVHERGLTNNPSTAGASAANLLEGATTNFRQANVTMGGTATHNPIFTLVPLGGDKFATQLLAPIKPQIFYELFEEGWPVDLLMRVLIERIELVNVNPIKAASTTKGAGEALEILVNNPLESSGGHYDRFLRACALAREFQKRGILYLDISDRFEPLAKNTVFPYPPTDQQQLSANKDGLIWKQLPDADDFAPPADPTLIKDVNDSIEPPAKEGAEAKGAAGGQREHGSHELALGNWQLGKNVQQTLFKLNQLGLEEASQELGQPDSVFSGNDNLTSKFKLVLANGIGVTDTETSKASYHVRLVMRSLIGSMLALANEQKTYQVFDTFRKSQEMQAVLERIGSLKQEIEGIENASGPMDPRKRQELTGDIMSLQTFTQESAEVSASSPEAPLVAGQIKSLTAGIDAIEGSAGITDEGRKRELADAIIALEGYVQRSVDKVPESEDHPVLLLTWPAKGSMNSLTDFDPDTKVASVTYNKQLYVVGDQKGLFLNNHGQDDPSLDTWNRDVFRLLVQLSLQVTADPSSFALPSLLQSSH